MGVSTNAILFYGICDSSDDEMSEETLFNIAKAFNINNFNTGEEVFIWDLLDEINDRLASEISLGTHCSGSCPMLYVFAKKSQILAFRGYPVQINIEGLKVESDVKNTLVNVAEKLGWDPPGWYLVSDWSR